MLTLEKLRRTDSDIPIGSKLLCYSGTPTFTEGDEYILVKHDEFGYYVGIDCGLSILFGSLYTLKSVFIN